MVHFREDHALEALTKFNARWYGGKQISAQFVEIPSWRRAICGKSFIFSLICLGRKS
jgi:hypothetical protein